MAAHTVRWDQVMLLNTLPLLLLSFSTGIFLAWVLKAVCEKKERVKGDLSPALVSRAA